MMARKTGPTAEAGKATKASAAPRAEKVIEPRPAVPPSQVRSWLIQRLPLLLLGAVLLLALLIAWRLRGGQSDLAGTWRGEGPSGATLILSLDGPDGSLSGSLSVAKAPKSPYPAIAHRQPDDSLVIAFATLLPAPFSGGWTCTLEDAVNLSCADGIRNLVVLTKSQGLAH